MKKMRKWLALLLTLTLILPNVSVTRAYAGGGTQEPAQGITVYVDAGKTGDGSSADQALPALEDAYQLIAKDSPDKGGTVVISGKAEVGSAGLDLSGYQIPGGVTLTSVYGDTDYRETSSAQLCLAGELGLSDKTVIENLNITMSAKAATASVFLYSGLDLRIKDGVSITDPDVAGRLKIFCGKKAGSAGQTINVSVSSGTYHTIFMGCSDSGITTGNVNLTIDGSTRVTSNVMVSPNKGVSGNLNFSMNGGYVFCVYNNAGTNTGSAGDATVNLNSGEIGKMTQYSGKVNSIGNFTVNLKSGFKYGLDDSSRLGNWTGLTTGTLTLNLIGFDGSDVLSQGFWDAYDTVNITGNSDVTYGYTLNPAPAIVVESGSRLRLSAHEDGTGLNVTGEGSILYGSTAEPEIHDTVYVNGEAGSDANDGLSAGQAFKTLKKAYEYLKANRASEGGTVVICGNTSVAEGTGFETYEISGPVTLTSDDGTETYPAVLTLGSNVTLGVNTVLNHISAAAGKYLYSGLSLTVGEDVEITGAPTLYCGLYAGDCGSVSVKIGSGSFQQILTGSTNNTGDCELTLSGTAEVTSNVTLGTSKETGKITFTMNGGTVKVIYDTPRDNGTVQDVILNLNGGSITGMKDYTKIKTKAVMNSITVNTGSEFILPALFGEWNAKKLTVTGEKALNLSAASGALTDGALANYTRIKIKDSSVVSYDSELKANAAVEVEKGSVLTLNAYTDAAEAESKGITFSGEGRVLFKGESVFLPVVYVDGTKEDSGDGKTAGTAVKSLTEAYKLLDPEQGGTVVICGDVVIDADLNLETLSMPGTVILTSVTESEDFRETASLVMKGSGRQLSFSDSTVMESMNIRTETTTGSQLLYSGLSLDIKDSVTCSGNGTLKIFCGRMSDTTGQTINVKIYGGTYNQIFMGSHTSYNTGNVNLEIGGNISVTSNIAFGANTTDSGNLNFTMNGGYVKVLYDTPSQNGKTGTVTATLNGGSITEMRDYNKKSGMQMGDITINVDSAFNCGSAQFGVWNSGVVTTGKKTLNLMHYQGGSMNSLGNYDEVNVFGGEMPAGFISSGGEDSLNLYDYHGLLGLSLDSFKEITASGSGCDTTFPGSVPVRTGEERLKLTAKDGAVLRIRPSENPGVTEDDFIITEENGGRVVFEEPAYEGKNEVVLDVDFNGSDAKDGSSFGNNGVISGNPEFTESFDGSKAVYLQNEFGTEASQYVSFPDMKGIDLSKDDFTIMFWYRTVNGGQKVWTAAGDASTAGAGLHMDQVKTGGVLFSNQDTVKDTSGFSAAQLPQNEFLTMGVTGADGAHYDKDGIRQASDDDWHMITVTYDRNSAYKVYVDGNLTASVNISGLAGETLGTGTLVIGSDAAGQYGLQNAYLDDLTVMGGVMSQTDIQANYYIGRLIGLVNAVEHRAGELGAEYDGYKASMLAKNEEVKARAMALTPADYPEAVGLYQQLKADYEAFLAAPEENAELSAILLSDIHISKAGDGDAVKLESVFRDLAENGLNVDLMINAGDFGDDSTPAATQAAYDVFFNLRSKYSLDDMLMIASYGNHEIQYTNKDACYKASTPVYWENIMNEIGEFVAAGKASVDSTCHDDDFNSNSYAASYKGYHFLVLNGDYLPQTGDSSTFKDADGKYSIEGNQYDPIRHGAHFDESTLTWAKSMLDLYSRDGLPIFVINHFPFIDTVPLSSYSEIVINDNSIGRQDAEVRRLLGNYDNVIYFCGHLHSSFGMNEPVRVVSDNGGSFTEVNISSIKGAARSYANVPATWIMYVYEDEAVLRARDFTTGEWMPQYDAVIRLTKNSDENPIVQAPIEIRPVDGEITEDTGDFVLNVSGGANELSYQFESSDESVLTVDSNGKVHIVGAGTAVITVKKSGEGFVTASAQITITVQSGSGSSETGGESSGSGSQEIPDNGGGADTADRSMPVLWAAAMGVSLAAAVLMIRKRRKAEN